MKIIKIFIFFILTVNIVSAAEMSDIYKEKQIDMITTSLNCTLISSETAE